MPIFDCDCGKKVSFAITGAGNSVCGCPNCHKEYSEKNACRLVNKILVLLSDDSGAPELREMDKKGYLILPLHHFDQLDASALQSLTTRYEKVSKIMVEGHGEPCCNDYVYNHRIGKFKPKYHYLTICQVLERLLRYTQASNIKINLRVCFGADNVYKPGYFSSFFYGKSISYQGSLADRLHQALFKRLGRTRPFSLAVVSYQGRAVQDDFGVPYRGMGTLDTWVCDRDSRSENKPILVKIETPAEGGKYVKTYDIACIYELVNYARETRFWAENIDIRLRANKMPMIADCITKMLANPGVDAIMHFISQVNDEHATLSREAISDSEGADYQLKCFCDCYDTFGVTFFRRLTGFLPEHSQQKIKNDNIFKLKKTLVKQ